jgi:hypothetical protein
VTIRGIRTSPQYRDRPREGVEPYDRDVVEAGHEQTPGRFAALLATFIDWVALLLIIAAALIVASAWLLLRTQAGRYDVPEFDSLAVVAFVTATVPMWAAWQAHRLYTYGATTGQALRGLRVQGAPGRRAARLVLHPAALPLWVWIAATGVMSGSRRIAVVVLGVAVIMLVLTGVTRVVRRPLYDLATGTRLVRAR